jgi:hypothetical protein
METEGNKIFKNVRIRWMSMFKPLKSIMVNYHPLLVAMQVDYITTTLKKVNYFMALICSYGIEP